MAFGNEVKNIQAAAYNGARKVFGIIKFLIQPLFRGQGRNLGNFFVGILVQTMTPKGHFEIN